MSLAHIKRELPNEASTKQLVLDANHVCPVCFQFMRMPVVTICCNNRFCRPCLDLIMFQTQGICPFCPMVVPASRAATYHTFSSSPFSSTKSSHSAKREGRAATTRTVRDSSSPRVTEQETRSPSDSSGDAAEVSQGDPSGAQQERKNTCHFVGCNKSFAKPSALKRHIRTHTGEKPFLCTYPRCGLQFAERGNLKRHTRVHTGEKQYVCQYPGCGYRFARMGHLAQHTKTQHKDTVFVPKATRKRPAPLSASRPSASTSSQVRSSSSSSGGTSVPIVPATVEPLPAAAPKAVTLSVLSSTAQAATPSSTTQSGPPATQAANTPTQQIPSNPS